MAQRSKHGSVVMLLKLSVSHWNRVPWFYLSMTYGWDHYFLVPERMSCLPKVSSCQAMGTPKFTIACSAAEITRALKNTPAPSFWFSEPLQFHCSAQKPGKGVSLGYSQRMPFTLKVAKGNSTLIISPITKVKSNENPKTQFLQLISVD